MQLSGVSVFHLKYYLYDYWEQESDPRTTNLFLMNGGPLTIVAIITGYLYFCKVLGPELMKNREPFQLRYTMLLYNTANVLISAWFFVETIYCLNYGLDLFNYKFPDRNDRSPRCIRCCRSFHIYFLTKIFDLLDTIFFVFRKKFNQISPLHIYHHSVVPILAWIGIKLLPTSSPVGLFPLLNSLVHVVMYAYYALSSFGPQIRKYLWWKKYITLLQLIQFIFLTIQGVMFIMFQSGYPPFIVAIGFVQPPLFFWLFYQFYKHSYCKPRNKH